MNLISYAILAVVLLIFSYALGVLVRRDRCDGRSDACGDCSVRKFCNRKDE